jgi:YegS/Rv2252/BmrU family lipid kinase
MRVTVIVNPKAGAYRFRKFERRPIETLVARVSACAGASAQVYVTEGPGGARTGAIKAMETGRDLVIAWGGDGTVNEIASVLAGTSAALGVVPAGSGNGLARELGIPRDPTDALRLALAYKTRCLDVGMLGDRAFVNVAGLGFDACVARRFNERHRLGGLTRYALFTIKEMLSYRPQHYALRWDEGSFEGAALFVAIANSRQYGNGACVAPLAQLDDGAVDLVVVRPTTAAGDLWRARKLYTGTILEDRGVTFARIRRGTIASPTGLWFHVDGEPVGAGTSLEVSVRPRALRVSAPVR